MSLGLLNTLNQEVWNLDSTDNKALLRRIGRRIREDADASLDSGLPPAMQARLQQLQEAERSNDSSSGGSPAVEPAE